MRLAASGADRVGVLQRREHPALVVAQALAGLIGAAATETGGEDDQPRAALPQVVDQLRGMADLLETITPAEHR
jgi:hypothetical protein